MLIHATEERLREAGAQSPKEPAGEDVLSIPCVAQHDVKERGAVSKEMDDSEAGSWSGTASG